MEAPQILVLLVYFVDLILAAIKNGERIKVSFAGNFIVTAVVMGLLIWGGFFS